MLLASGIHPAILLLHRGSDCRLFARDFCVKQPGHKGTLELGWLELGKERFLQAKSVKSEQCFLDGCMRISPRLGWT